MRLRVASLALLLVVPRWRVQATTLGVIWEIAPNRVRLLVDGVRRAQGPRQTRTDTLIGQLQVRF